MQNLNRRQWLRTAGMAAGALPLLGFKTSVPSFEDYLKKVNHLPPGILAKLCFNENPFGPSQKVRDAMTGGFDNACRYPFMEVDEVTKKLAEKEGVSPDHILVTVGSTEGLKITALAYAINGGEIVAPSPTFEAMLQYAEHFGGYVNRVLVDDELKLDLAEMERRVTNNTRLVFVCNPNNPTGAIIPGSQVQDFCETLARRTTVFCDEAYLDYITEPDYPSMVGLVKKNLNVIVSRTFSKVYGMAGIRIGYLIARPDIIARIDPGSVDRPNMLALHAALAALEDQEFYKYSLKMNASAKDAIYQTLDKLGLRYLRSHTNFVFFKTGRDIGGFIREMQQHGVQVGRPFPPFTDWCRVSTGKMDEVETFNKGLVKVFG